MSLGCQRDGLSRILAELAIAATTGETGDLTGGVIDNAAFNSLTFALGFANVSGGTPTIQVEMADDLAFTQNVETCTIRDVLPQAENIPGSAVEGAVSVTGAGNFKIGYVGYKPFARVKVNANGATYDLTYAVAVESHLDKEIV